jgi:hypothetical protein
MKKNYYTIYINLFSSIGFSPKRTQIDFEAPDNTIDYGKVKNTENGIRFYFLQIPETRH